MLRMSDNVKAISDRLIREPDRIWLGKRAREERVCSLIEELVNTNDAAAVLPAFRFLFDKSEVVRTTSRIALTRLVARFDDDDYIEADNVFRHLARYYYVGTRTWDQWNTLKPRAVASLTRDSTEQPIVLGLASFHHNGFVRHAAVTRLAQLTDGRELPFLILRQNDWVDAISQAARLAVSKRIRAEYLESLIRHISLVFRPLRWRRQDLSETRQQLVALATSEPHLLQAIISNPQRWLARELLKAADGPDGITAKRIVDAGLKSPDPIVRLKSVRSCCVSYSRDERENLYRHLVTDKFMPLRREGFIGKATNSPESAIETWRVALLDRSASIRERARFELRKLGEQEFASFYREALERSPSSHAALAGLGETGSKPDIDIFRRYLSFPTPRWRRAAIIGMARVGDDGELEELVASLADDSPSVSNRVRRVLERRQHVVPADHLFRFVINDQRAHVQRIALAMIDNQTKWRAVPFLLRAAASPDEELASDAAARLAGWFHGNKSVNAYVRPTAASCDAVISAWNDCQERLPPALRTQLRSWLHDALPDRLA